MPDRPHSTELEQAVLGALLQEPSSFVDVRAIVVPADFYDPAHREVFAAMDRLHEKQGTFDLLTVSQELSDSDHLNAAGGSSYLAGLTNAVPITANVEQHAQLVQDKSLRRRLMNAGKGIAALGEDTKTPQIELLEKAENQLFDVCRVAAGGEPETLGSVAAKTYDYYAELHEADDKEAMLGLPTGFAALDHKLRGLENGALVVIAARPSVGKTALALSIARHIADRAGKSVAFFSLEMSKRSMVNRILASTLSTDTFLKLTRGTLPDAEFRKLDSVFDSLNRCQLAIDDEPLTIPTLRSKARRMHMKHGLDLIVVDYLQLIEVTDRTVGENRTQQVSYISRSLKNLARELDCPIIALSQLSRKTEERMNAIPQLADLRDSGSIEQDADIVLMLYREEIYNEDGATPGLTDVYIKKNRNGATGRVEMMFRKEHMDFTSIHKERANVPCPSS